MLASVLFYKFLSSVHPLQARETHAGLLECEGLWLLPSNQLVLSFLEQYPLTASFAPPSFPSHSCPPGTGKLTTVGLTGLQTLSALLF